MKKVFSTLMAVACAMGMSAAVTPHFAIEAGYDHGLAHVRTPDLGYSYYFANAQMDGFHAGANVQLDFTQGSQHIPGLVIGVNYQFLTANLANKNVDIKNALEDFKATAKALGGTDVVASDYAYMHNLQIPIRFNYTYQINNNWRFFAQTGPQIRLHLGLSDNLKQTYNYNGKKNGSLLTADYVTGIQTMQVWLNGETTKDSKDMERIYRYDVFDMTWGFGLGFAWKGLGLSFTYDLGMINLFNSDLAKDPRFGGEKWKYNSDALAVTLSYRIK